MLLLLLTALTCRNHPEPVDTGCADAGDIDQVRYNMAREACAWTIECGLLTMDDWENCYTTSIRTLDAPVMAGECIDWCGAREYHQDVRGRACEDHPGDPDEYESIQPELLTFFSTCDEPNYEPVP